MTEETRAERARPTHDASPTFRAAVDRYASNMRAAGLEVIVIERSPGHVTVSGREPGSGCGCCELGEYAGDLDADDVSCPNCDHSPEEHGL